MKVSMFFAAALIAGFAAAAWAQADEWKPAVTKDGIEVYYRVIDDASQKKQVTTVKVRNKNKKAFDVVVEIQQDLPRAGPGELVPPMGIRHLVPLHVKARSEAISNEVLMVMDGITGRVRLFCMSKAGAREKCEVPAFPFPTRKP